MGLQDKVCIVTGGGSGIGRGAALLMAQNGAKIALVGRTASKIEAVRDEIEAAGSPARTFAFNVADYEAAQQMAKDVIAAFGRIDVLVNNAGHSSANRRLLNMMPEETRQVVDSNLIGTIFCTRAVVPFMLEAKSGTIINVSSVAAIQPGPFGGLAYGAAKAAVNNFTQFLNVELLNTGVRASVIMPGEINTPILELRPVPPSVEARATMADVEDTSELICFIASLPQRVNIPEVIIRPTMQRDVSEEIQSVS